MPVDPTRAESLFHAARALPPGNRPAFLDRACASDPDLRAGVERLLAADAELNAGSTVSYAPQPPTAPDVLGSNADPDGLIGGRYKLLEKLGEGGMGSVWMAQQTEPVKRRVAVKFIRAGVDSRTVLARFEAERQALALMDHPNIARVFDGGATPDGRPFFAMELVKGVPITDFCDAHKLTPAARLGLFAQVCAAVQHAHQKGIIHRDIKPSNVLVALYDDTPVPKVIDFGVAKAAGQPLTDKTLATGFGAVVGTPEYMSPEQAGFNNLDIDTRSDVYALGALLYELLAGSPPHPRQQLARAGLLEMLRVVREVEPPRPSQRLSTAETRASLAAVRGGDPGRLSALLKGELDWVVMKALEKDRTRRYETAAGLAQDVQRFLSGEPVQAVPPTAGYRLRKFVRRNRPQVLAAGLVLLALVAGVVGTTLGLIEARRQEGFARDEATKKEQARAEEARQRGIAEENERAARRAAAAESKAQQEANEKRLAAERNLAYARKSNVVLGIVFEGLNPRVGYLYGADLRNALRNNLKAAVKELDAAAIDDPLEVAALQHILGTSLQGLGDFDPAVAVLTRAKDARLAHLGPDHPDALRSMNQLALAYRDAGQFASALPLHEEVVTRSTNRRGRDHPDTLAALDGLATTLTLAGQPERAVALLDEALALSTARRGRRDPDTLTYMSHLAKAHQRAGRADQALTLYEEACQHSTASPNPDQTSTMSARNDLAAAYLLAGKPDKAWPLYDLLLKSYTVQLGRDHPDTLACIHALAEAYIGVRRWGEALPLAEEAFTSRSRRVGPEHPDTLDSRRMLARI
ncbi:MAG: serine/threonine-protein kinase, partial [Gemmataceae bacterium]|nr:serine/threonine-protein kinase [Gemmataceae bacterium]